MGGAAVAPLLVAAFLLVSGCVTRGTYDEVVAERDELAERRTTLEHELRRERTSNESLEAERLELFESIEALRSEKQRVEGELERREQELERLQSTYQALIADLESEIASGEIRIAELRDGLTVNLPDSSFFDPGSVRVNSAGRQVLARVAEQLRSLPHRIEVRGHTDDQPVTGALARRFPSNWELAGARAAEVVRLLAEEGIDPARMRAVSFGEHQPLGPNETPEQRARNRRVEIRLIPVSATDVATRPQPRD